VHAYRALTFRGGLDAAPELSEEVRDDIGSPEFASLVEIRRYRMHRRIERNPSAAKAAKQQHGVRCQACHFEFGETYGAIGHGFIEAHHLRPISQLQEGMAVEYDVASDFAVLCSNCHRMIHRTTDRLT
jgi:5-methylcytosine-specific restriction enzyme A